MCLVFLCIFRPALASHVVGNTRRMAKHETIFPSGLFKLAFAFEPLRMIEDKNNIFLIFFLFGVCVCVLRSHHKQRGMDEMYVNKM